MGYRRKARECALQMLFQIDMTGEPDVRVRKGYWSQNPAPPAVREYADRLVGAAAGDRDRIDGLIQLAARNWRVDRMARVDRNVLRMAVGELLHEPGTPFRVVINEAIEIAKKYSSDESAQFVNGILDAVRREIDAVAGTERA